MSKIYTSVGNRQMKKILFEYPIKNLDFLHRIFCSNFILIFFILSYFFDLSTDITIIYTYIYEGHTRFAIIAISSIMVICNFLDTFVHIIFTILVYSISLLLNSFQSFHTGVVFLKLCVVF